MSKRRTILPVATAGGLCLTVVVLLLCLLPPDARARVGPEPADPGSATGLDSGGPLTEERLRDLQRLLQQIDLYKGPADGRRSKALERAIRAYQRAAKLPEDGRDSQSLLDHVELNVQRQLLARKLDQAAKRSKKRARTALLKQPETRGLVTGEGLTEADRIADPTRDPTACFAAPTPACLLAEATESAKAENKDELRDWAYGDIVAVHAQDRRVKDAYGTARLIDDPRKIVVAVRRIAEAQAGGGDMAGALKTIDLVPNAFQRSEALVAILEGRLFGDDAAGERLLLDRLQSVSGDLTEPSKQVHTLAKLAVGYWRRGDAAASTTALEQASTLVDRLGKKASTRAFGLGAIAEALAATDRPREAMRVLQQVTDDWHRNTVVVNIVAPLAAREGRQPAIEVADSIGQARYQAIALANIARTDVTRGAFDAADGLLDRALSVVADIDVAYARSFAASKVTLAAALLPDFERVVAISDRIDHEAMRAKTLWEVLLRRSEAAGTALAPDLPARVLELSEAVPSVIDRASVFADAAVIMANAGRPDVARQGFDRALKTAATINNPWNRAQVLTKVAAALIALGR